WDKLVDEEAEKRMDQDDVARVALANAEANGIVFLDEIDKIAVSDVRGGSVSREGVQRDLLPLIEGTTVATKYGPMKTDHVLFIGSGAFHLAKPSDMLPELQGRLPIRVELKALTEEDFVAILSDTRANLVTQYKALIGTENVTLDFTPDAIREIARIAAQVNESVENIGARRLQTVMEKLLEELSFEAEDRKGEAVTIDADYVRAKPTDLAQDADLVKGVVGCERVVAPLPLRGAARVRSRRRSCRSARSGRTNRRWLHSGRAPERCAHCGAFARPLCRARQSRRCPRSGPC